MYDHISAASLQKGQLNCWRYAMQAMKCVRFLCSPMGRFRPWRLGWFSASRLGTGLRGQGLPYSWGPLGVQGRWQQY